MHPYKVVYLAAIQLTKAKDWIKEGSMDGVSTATDLEALLVEQEKAGYELVTMVPLTGNIAKSTSFVNTTTGFMVTFRLKGTS
jgi:hypothetical protein